MTGPAAAALTGLVLAGGRSSRMGADKATLLRDGRTLVALVAESLTTICSEVLVASGDGQRLPGPWRQVADAEPNLGPLGGIAAGLAAARAPLVAVVAVDVGEPALDLFRDLASHWDGEAWAVVPRTDGRLQPLHALYATDAADALAEALREGARSPTRLLAERLGVLVVDVPAERVPLGVNTPQEARDAGIEHPEEPSTGVGEAVP